jgi:hypothetical protein
MADGYYELIGLVPTSSDFTLERAVEFYSSQFYARLNPVRAELARGEGEMSPTGFRVWYGSWAVVAWLDCRPSVIDDNSALAEEPDLPAPPNVIASCPHRLWIYSDVDEPDFANSDYFTDYTDQLRERFGVFLLDNVSGGWWT